MGAIYNLGDRAISVALTDVVLTEGVSSAGVAQALMDQLAGMNAVTLIAAFTYGSGGTTAIVTIETAFGPGGVWVPIARFDFATASATKAFNLSGLTPKIAPVSLAALGAEGAVDGVLGDRLRAKLTTTGVYAGSTLLSVRAATRS